MILPKAKVNRLLGALEALVAIGQPDSEILQLIDDYKYLRRVYFLAYWATAMGFEQERSPSGGFLWRHRTSYLDNPVTEFVLHDDGTGYYGLTLGPDNDGVPTDIPEHSAGYLHAWADYVRKFYPRGIGKSPHCDLSRKCLMPLSEFQEAVRQGMFTNYDGHGDYATEEYQYALGVDLETVVDHPVPGFTHVCWFNK